MVKNLLNYQFNKYSQYSRLSSFDKCNYFLSSKQASEIIENIVKSNYTIADFNPDYLLKWELVLNLYVYDWWNMNSVVNDSNNKSIINYFKNVLPSSSSLEESIILNSATIDLYLLNIKIKEIKTFNKHSYSWSDWNRWKSYIS